MALSYQVLTNGGHWRVWLIVFSYNFSIGAISLSVSTWHLNDDPAEVSLKKQDVQLCLYGLSGLITNKV